jgi:RNA polymerase sigma factor (TIGR02999 family)
MDGSAPGEITQLLQAAQEGDRASFDEVYRLVYDELHALAHAVRSGGNSATLSTTALVHEAYLKLIPAPRGRVQDRSHFYAIAARAMRQVLVDAARKRTAARRGAGAEIMPIDDVPDATTPAADVRSMRAEEIMAIDEVLRQLQEWNPRQASVVECRVFGGLSVTETAQALGVSEPTVKRDWQTARAWLAQALGHA